MESFIFFCSEKHLVLNYSDMNEEATPMKIRNVFKSQSNIYDVGILQKQLRAFSRQRFLQKFSSKLFVRIRNARFEMKWVKVFKDGPSKICGRPPLKSLKRYGLPYPFKYFKGCVPQILLIPFLNVFTHIKLKKIISSAC